jgi:hypothetical protein
MQTNYWKCENPDDPAGGVSAFLSSLAAAQRSVCANCLGFSELVAQTGEWGDQEQ